MSFLWFRLLQSNTEWWLTNVSSFDGLLLKWGSKVLSYHSTNIVAMIYQIIEENIELIACNMYTCMCDIDNVRHFYIKIWSIFENVPIWLFFCCYWFPVRETHYQILSNLNGRFYAKGTLRAFWKRFRPIKLK